jgi:hypothetical protein
MAPALIDRAAPMAPRFVEEAALSVLAHVMREQGPVREALVADRRRFEVLAAVVHRLPPAGGGGQ